MDGGCMDGGVIQFDDPADEPLLPLSKEITSKEQEGDDDAQHSCKKTEAAPPGPLELENEEYRHTGQKGQAKDEQSELRTVFNRWLPLPFLCHHGVYPK
jgi:hypothetical protein